MATEFDLTLIDIDPEFRSFMPTLTPEERQDLQANISKDGFRDPLVVWRPREIVNKVVEYADRVILLDGHNRFEIWDNGDCQQWPAPLVEELGDMEGVDSREDALNWIANNQTGRRNLTPKQASYFRGRIYNQTKRESTENLKNGADFPKGQNVPSGETAEKLAEQHGVTAKTIKRDGKFAAAVDARASEKGPEERSRLLNSTKPKREVVEDVKPPKPEKTPREKALDYLKGAERSLGGLQDNITEANRLMAVAGLKKMDEGKFDQLVADIFKGIKAAKERCK